MPMTTLSILCLYLFLHICVFAAPHPGNAPKRSVATATASKDDRANSLDLNDRYMSKAKKWYEEGNADNFLLAAHPPASAFLDSQAPMLDAPTGFGFGNGMGGAPFLPDKWGDLFLAQQQRSFLPYNNVGVEKRRRLSDDKQQQFLDNYLNLLEPGNRFEWNLNRL